MNDEAYTKRKVRASECRKVPRVRAVLVLVAPHAGVLVVLDSARLVAHGLGADWLRKVLPQACLQLPMDLDHTG